MSANEEPSRRPGLRDQARNDYSDSSRGGSQGHKRPNSALHQTQTTVAPSGQPMGSVAVHADQRPLGPVGCKVSPYLTAAIDKAVATHMASGGERIQSMQSQLEDTNLRAMIKVLLEEALKSHPCITKLDELASHLEEEEAKGDPVSRAPATSLILPKRSST